MNAATQQGFVPGPIGPNSFNQFVAADN